MNERVRDVAAEKESMRPQYVQLLLAIVIAAAVALVYQIARFQHLKAEAEKTVREIETESFNVLKAAKTPTDLREAAGELGVTLWLPEEQWIAIRYRDVHTGPVVSSAVARDSGGGWWISKEHFCGRFRAFKKKVGQLTDSGSEEERSLHAATLERSFPHLASVNSAQSLDIARLGLQKLGFRRHPGPY